jgi:hypothetical protein
MGVFKNAMTKYRDKFPHPPQGIGLSLLAQGCHPLYVTNKENVCRDVLSRGLGVPKPTRLFAPYKGIKYHLPEFQQGPMPKGKRELFNYAHSSF